MMKRMVPRLYQAIVPAARSTDAAAGGFVVVGRARRIAARPAARQAKQRQAQPGSQRIEQQVVHLKHPQLGQELDDFNKRGDGRARQQRCRNGHRRKLGQKISHRHKQQQIDDDELQGFRILQVEPRKIALEKRPHIAPQGKRLPCAGQHLETVAIVRGRRARQKRGIQHDDQVARKRKLQIPPVVRAVPRAVQKEKSNRHRSAHDDRPPNAVVGKQRKHWHLLSTIAFACQAHKGKRP